MSLTFGPEVFYIAPTNPSQVFVENMDNTPATLSSPVSIDAQGKVTFTVSNPGRYKVTAKNGAASQTKSIYLAEDVEYKTTDPRSVLQYLIEKSEENGGTGGGAGLPEGGFAGQLLSKIANEPSKSELDIAWTNPRSGVNGVNIIPRGTHTSVYTQGNAVTLDTLTPSVFYNTSNDEKKLSVIVGIKEGATVPTAETGSVKFSLNGSEAVIGIAVKSAEAGVQLTGRIGISSTDPANGISWKRYATINTTSTGEMTWFPFDDTQPQWLFSHEDYWLVFEGLYDQFNVGEIDPETTRSRWINITSPSPEFALRIIYAGGWSESKLPAVGQAHVANDYSGVAYTYTTGPDGSLVSTLLSGKFNDFSTARVFTSLHDPNGPGRASSSIGAENMPLWYTWTATDSAQVVASTTHPINAKIDLYTSDVETPEEHELVSIGSDSSNPGGDKKIAWIPFHPEEGKQYWIKITTYEQGLIGLRFVYGWNSYWDSRY